MSTTFWVINCPSLPGLPQSDLTAPFPGVRMGILRRSVHIIPWYLSQLTDRGGGVRELGTCFVVEMCFSVGPTALWYPAFFCRFAPFGPLFWCDSGGRVLSAPSLETEYLFLTHTVCARTQATHTTKGRSVQSIALWGNRSELLPPFSLSYFFLSWHHFLLFVCLFWNAWCKSYPREVEAVLTAISLRRAWRERWRDDWEGSWSPLLSFSSHSPALASLIWSLCCCYDWRERKGGGWTDCYFLFFSLRERSDLRSERQPRPERRGVVGILYFATLM